MKLSDVKGERTFDVIADIIEPVGNLSDCGEMKKVFDASDKPADLTASEFMVQRIKQYLPIVLKKHKNDFIAILATIECVSVERYTQTLNLAKLFVDVTELLTDEAFLGFLDSQQQTTTD